MSVEISVPNPKLTALYCRVSTQDQHSGLESQIRVLKEYCNKNSIQNYEIFSDEGISGAKSSRPSLDKMMVMARENKLERVVCYSFSRYARSVTHLLTALEEFRKLNISFVSYTESVDTNSPMGRAFFTLTGRSVPAHWAQGKTPDLITFSLCFEPSAGTRSLPSTSDSKAQ